MMAPVEFTNILENVRVALEQDDVDRAKLLLDTLAPARAETTLAEAIGDLDLAEQAELLPQLEWSEAADVLEYLDEDEAAQIAARLRVADLSEMLNEMAPDEAADILLDLDLVQAHAALEAMVESKAALVRPLLKHKDDTAGGRMTTELPILRRWMSVNQAITYLRNRSLDDDDHYYLYVVDRDRELIGVVGLRELIISHPNVTIGTIMNREVIQVTTSTDQRTCAQLISRYELFSLPVVDDAGHLVGVITHDDLVEVIEDEATEDLYAMANVSADSDLDVFSPWPVMVRKRLPWLFLNLCTAFFASFVISRFEATIAEVAILAVFQSIVAGLGGNSGTQTLAIIIRGIALGQLELRQARGTVLREIGLAVFHGICIGVCVGLIAWFWKGIPMLGVVIALAVIGNFVIASIAGTLVPLTLRKLGMDPALASSIFLTATTDSLGFALFLGLATAFLPYLK